MNDEEFARLRATLRSNPPIGWEEDVGMLLNELDRSMQELSHCQQEHLATQELHERSMRIIENALGPMRTERNTWRAQAIADDIRALRATISLHEQN